MAEVRRADVSVARLTRQLPACIQHPPMWPGCWRVAALQWRERTLEFSRAPTRSVSRNGCPAACLQGRKPWVWPDGSTHDEPYDFAHPMPMPPL